jgi:hypothetical protein
MGRSNDSFDSVTLYYHTSFPEVIYSCQPVPTGQEQVELIVSRSAEMQTHAQFP